MAERSRFTFRCHSCDRQQTREIRSGHYVTCKHCGASNPGPKMIADMQASATSRQRQVEPRRRRVAPQTMVTRREAAAARTAPAGPATRSKIKAPAAAGETGRQRSAGGSSKGAGAAAAAGAAGEGPPQGGDDRGPRRGLWGTLLHGAP